MLSLQDYRNINGEPQTPALTCDALSRLTSASAAGGPANYSESYAYNAATGNLETKGAWTLAYTDPNHPHAVTAAGGNTYAYDANGNQVTRVIGSNAYTLTYDAENRLVQVSGPGLSAQFTYDGDGRRVASTVNGVTTAFVGNHYEVTGSSITKYYFAGASRVAMRQNGTLYFLLSDHLGSTSLTLDANGNKLAGLRYTAWGAVRHADGVTPTPYTFTGQYSHMAQFGLMFFNARWLDPALGRFAQADTVIPEASQGAQAWDRYAFVNNNPVIYSDPTGHWLNIALGAIAGAIVGVSLYAINIASADQNFDFGEATAVATVGAAAGALISTGIGATAGIEVFAGLGLATGGAGNLIANTITGSEFQTSDFLVSSAYGFANGALGPVVGTTLPGAVTLGGVTSVLQYTATQTINGEPLTPSGVKTALGTGMLAGALGGRFPKVDPYSLVGKSVGELIPDEDFFLGFYSDALLRKVPASLLRSILGGVVSNYDYLPQDPDILTCMKDTPC